MSSKSDNDDKDLKSVEPGTVVKVSEERERKRIKVKRKVGVNRRGEKNPITKDKLFRKG